MRNEKGQFVKGHKESTEIKIKRSISLKHQWVNRGNYHAMTNTKFYNSWRSMTTRCKGTAGKESMKKYKDKGITVCDRWLKFKNFYEDMFPSYKEGLTIDRINNSEGYYFNNCRWATPFEQANNKSNVVKIEYNGMVKTMSEWAIYLGITRASINIRYHRYYKKGLITVDKLLKIPHTIEIK